jgi:hypothetical protein
MSTSFTAFSSRKEGTLPKSSNLPGYGSPPGPDRAEGSDGSVDPSAGHRPPWVRRTAAPASPPRGRMDGTSKGRGELGMITVKKIYGDNDEHCMKIYGNYMEICGNWMKFLNYQNIQDNSSMIVM